MGDVYGIPLVVFARVNGGKRKLAFRTRYNVVATCKRAWFGKTTHFVRLCQKIKRLLYERENVLASSDLDSTSEQPRSKGKVRGKGKLSGSLWAIDLGKPSLYRHLEKSVAIPTLRKSVAIATLCPKASLDGCLQTSQLPPNVAIICFTKIW